MKVIIISFAAMVAIAIVAAYGLDLVLAEPAQKAFTGDNVRLD